MVKAAQVPSTHALHFCRGFFQKNLAQDDGDL